MYPPKGKTGLINKMKNENNKSNYPLAYLDEEQDALEENPSQEGENENTLDESSDEPLHKNPQFQKAIRNWRSTEKELAETKVLIEEQNAKIEALSKASAELPQEAPDYWAKAYETTEQANSAWEVMRKHDAELLRQVDSLAEAKAKQILGADTEAETRWSNHIENELNKLEELKEIDATSNSPQAKKLRAGIKKVWEEYSPTNENGELIFIPIEKAYDIYQKEEQLNKSPRNEARRQMASISTVRSSVQARDVQPTNQIATSSKWSKLPWRSQISQNE